MPTYWSIHSVGTLVSTHPADILIHTLCRHTRYYLSCRQSDPYTLSAHSLLSILPTYWSIHSVGTLVTINPADILIHTLCRHTRYYLSCRQSDPYTLSAHSLLSILPTVWSIHSVGTLVTIYPADSLIHTLCRHTRYYLSCRHTNPYTLSAHSFLLILPTY